MWNKPFKAKVTEQYDEWMAGEAHSFTAAGNMGGAPRKEIVKWFNMLLPNHVNVTLSTESQTRTSRMLRPTILLFAKVTVTMNLSLIENN